MTTEQMTEIVQRRITSLNRLLSEREITASEYVEMAYCVLEYWVSKIRDIKSH